MSPRVSDCAIARVMAPTRDFRRDGEMEHLDRLLVRFTGWMSLATFVGVVAAVWLLAQTPSGDVAQEEARRPPIQRVEVRMREFKFEPARIEVQAGRVQLVLRNEGVIPHDLSIPALGVKSGYVPAKKEEVLTLEVQPGTYAVECTVGGHKEAGMRGTLVVR